MNWTFNGETLDDRLCVTESLFTLMIAEVNNMDLAQVLDAYQDYITTQEMSWSVHAVIKPAIDETDYSVFDPNIKVAEKFGEQNFRVFSEMRGKISYYNPIFFLKIASKSTKMH